MAVNNQVVVCDVCETEVLVKFQVGVLDVYPVYYSCPTCLTNIYGNISIDHDKGMLTFKLQNATNKNGMEGSYILVLSGEFPSIKMIPFTEETFKASLFSPFIRYSPHSAKAHRAYEVLLQFVPLFINDEWKKVERITNLYFNGQDIYLESEIEKLRESPRINMSPYEKDSSVSKLVTTIFREMVLCKPLSVVSDDDLTYRLDSFKQNNPNEYEEFLCFSTRDDLLRVQKSLFTLFDAFANHYRYLSPVVYLEGKGELISEVKNHEGLNTVSFDLLDRLYQNTFETLLANSTICLMLDNLLVRGSIHSMNPSIQVRNRPVVTLQDYMSLTNGQKLKYLSDETNIISHVFTDILDNDLRNPIGHNNYSYDPNSQLIHFHSNRSNQPPKVMYLIEFADKCFQTMKVNLLLWDLTVLIRKLITQR
ncbi:hypothetical protein [Paenibacillus sp. FSL R5-0701]|uniref:hypothetical protein n=1 Tax=Paenibacillus sp. FSL R5-0701 TaxID=2921654 RepID=UPI0030CB7F52